MRKDALYHRSSGNFAYPVGPARMRLVVRAARRDLTAATCIHLDRYQDPSRAELTAMRVTASDDLHDYWTVTIPVPTRRLAYGFYLESKDGSYWFSERGVANSRHGFSPFNYPYINPADVFRQPDWLPGGVIYQVFPDRFFNGDVSNDPPGTEPWGAKPEGRTFTGGDLKGIEQKLSWLEELGASCLYTTPIFRSPSNHRYNTTDYYAIEPTLGTEDEFLSLLQTAHARGIKVILDVAFNHSGSDFFAFRDVIDKGPASAYAHWFNIHSFPVRPEREGRNYETFANHVPTMPKLMTQVPEVREYLLRVAEHWTTRAGLDGWRLDVANEVDHSFWQEFRRRVRGINPNAFIIGEVWHDALPWLQGDQFDSVLNYPWRTAVLDLLNDKIDIVQFDTELARLRFLYPGAATGALIHQLGNHDTPRIMTALGGIRPKARLAAVLLFTAQGIPLVYYGDEIGMEGEGDPDCRRCMVWEPEKQDREMLALYRKLGRLRRALPWLNTGEWKTLLVDPLRGIYAYERSGALAANAAPIGNLPEAPDERIWVVLNVSYRENTVLLPGSEGMVDLLDQGRLPGPSAPGIREGQPITAEGLRMPPGGAAILVPPVLIGRLA